MIDRAINAERMINCAGCMRVSLSERCVCFFQPFVIYFLQPLVSEKQQFGSIQEENCGSINLSVGYEIELSLLTVRVIRAQDLNPPSLPAGGCPSVDSYCRICLLPNRRRQFHTKVQRRTTNPEFDEEFVFDVTQGELVDAALELAVFDGSEGAVVGDTGNCLGVVHLPLYEINLTEKVWLWKGISPFVRENEVSRFKFSASTIFHHDLHSIQLCRPTLLLQYVINEALPKFRQSQ